MRQAERLALRALLQSGFHQGTHLEVKDRVVRGMVVSAALRTETEKKVRSSEAEEKVEGGLEM